MARIATRHQFAFVKQRSGKCSGGLAVDSGQTGSNGTFRMQIGLGYKIISFVRIVIAFTVDASVIVSLPFHACRGIKHNALRSHFGESRRHIVSVSRKSEPVAYRKASIAIYRYLCGVGEAPLPKPVTGYKVQSGITDLYFHPTS